MDRREALRTLGGAALLGLAGCTGGPGGDGGGDDATTTPDTTTSDDDTTTADDDTTTAGSPAFGDAALEARDGDCPADGPATVEFVTDDAAVRVDGCVRGANGCTVATLADASYDSAADELTVVVGTEEDRETGEACTEAVVTLPYRVRATFEGALPGTVTVVHDDVDGRATATTASRE